MLVTEQCLLGRPHQRRILGCGAAQTPLQLTERFGDGLHRLLLHRRIPRLQVTAQGIADFADLAGQPDYCLELPHTLSRIELRTAVPGDPFLDLADRRQRQLGTLA
ncbi:hypothetical protein D3C85_1141560 [compost metagenome]